MRDVQISVEDFLKGQYFNLQEYKSKLFHMFAGEPEIIEIEFDQCSYRLFRVES
uniref:hypothetical protein n=1 Tax=Jeotgalibacillus alimentarius TaxID=135826 RepID=UPI003898F396